MLSAHSVSFKILSVFLSLAILAVSLPLSAFASETNESSVPSLEEEFVSSTAEIVEVNEMRSADEKAFRLTDGNFYIAHYDTEIHEQNEDGVWQDIDNRLYINGDRIMTENGRYIFPYKTGEDTPLFSLSAEEYGIAFLLDHSSNDIQGRVTNTSTEFKDGTDRLEILTTLDNIRSSVSYENILPETNVEFVLLGKNVKENIIVKEPNSEYSYSFILSLNHLYPEVSENGQINLLDTETGEVIYFLPAPAMWDNSGAFSDAVSYQLSADENETWSLTMTADAGWINDESRVFPVTVDPSVYSSSSNVLDTYISSADPSSSYSTDTSLYVSSTKRAYWKLTTLPSLPQSAYITKAEFKAKAYPVTDSPTEIDVAAYEVLNDWDSTLTWNQTTASTNPIGQIADTFTDYKLIKTIYSMGSFFFGGIGEFTWNITPIVKKWYDGYNYGVAFAIPTGGSSTGTAQFRSNDYGTSSYRPSLCITYSDMKGIEDYWSFTSRRLRRESVCQQRNGKPRCEYSNAHDDRRAAPCYTGFGV